VANNSDPENQSPQATLNQLSAALTLVSRGDPMVALRNEIQTQFESVRIRINSTTEAFEARLDAIDKATELQHQDQVRVPTQIDKAIENLLALIQSKLDAIEADLVEVREYSHRRPEDLDQAIAHQRDLLTQTIRTEVAVVMGELRRHIAETAEKFLGVRDQFGGRDTALAAALLAQKTSVEDQNKSNAQAATKAEDRFTKEIDSAKDTVTAQARTFDDKINAVRSEFSISSKSADDKIEDIRARIGAVENQKKGALDNWGAIVVGVGLLVTIVGGIIGFMSLSSSRAAAPIVIERSSAGDKVVP